MSGNPGFDPAAFLATVLTEVCFGSEDSQPLEATIDCYFATDYWQRTDGHRLSRNEFVEHIRALRNKILRGQVEILEVVQQGRRIADRHLVTVTKHDGSVSRIEVHLFGELTDDRRLHRIEELTRVVSGTAEDAELGRTR
jgi:hypothetical protein